MTEKANSNGGQAIVEFAIITIILFILIVGTIEFGIIMYDQAVLTNGIREGARAACLFRADPTTGAYLTWTLPEIQTVVNNYVQDRLITFGTPFDKSTVQATWTDPDSSKCTSQCGKQITVWVTFPYHFLALPNLGALKSGTINLSARAIMLTEKKEST